MPDASKTDRNYWKSTIMKINDRKLLDYIRDMVQIRLDHDRAEENMDKADKKMKGDKKSTGSPIEYEPPRRNLKPMAMTPAMKDAASKEDESLY